MIFTEVVSILKLLPFKLKGVLNCFFEKSKFLSIYVKQIF